MHVFGEVILDTKQLDFISLSKVSTQFTLLDALMEMEENLKDEK